MGYIIQRLWIRDEAIRILKGKGEDMEQYVIYLSSVNSDFHVNAYGYWTGKDYTVQGVKYPVTRDRKGLDVKMYHNKKVAENALSRCINRYENVVSGRVEEIKIVVGIDMGKSI